MIVPTAKRRSREVEGIEFSPTLVTEIELTKPLPAIDPGGRYQRALVLGRLHTEPIGVCFVDLPKDGLRTNRLSEILWTEFQDVINARFLAAGLPPARALASAGLAINPAEWPFTSRRLTTLAAAPFISLVICTRDRPRQLEACLSRVDYLEYPSYEVIIVDNAATDETVASIVNSHRGRVAYHYISEPRAGLSWARNAGSAAASGDIIAFIDDDTVPDKYWLSELASGFARSDDIGCVTGIILPTRLETPAQEIFEDMGGHSKGRGFEAMIFSHGGPQNPLYPLPPFGAGANMAFRRDTLEQIGGFDVALGAGTPTRAGEDTLALTLTMLAGFRIAYEPAALVWHDHRSDMASLSEQLYGYGAGLTSYYMALLRHRPSLLPSLLKLVPTAVNYLRAERAAPAASPGALEELLSRQRRGMLMGPFSYINSVRGQARAVATSRPLEE
jgi:GT2 family glycosyltransferase